MFIVGTLSASMQALMQNFVNALSSTGLLTVVQVVGFILAAAFLFKTVKRERRNFTFRGIFEIVVMIVFMVMVVIPVATAGAIGGFLSGAGGVAVSLYQTIRGSGATAGATAGAIGMFHSAAGGVAASLYHAIHG